MYEFVTGRSLFAVMSFGSDTRKADDDHLLQLTGLLGPLSDELYEKWTRSGLYFDADRKPIDSTEGCGGEPDSSLGQPGRPNGLEAAFERNKPSDLGDEDAHNTVALVRGILQYEPAKRPSIDSLLRHSWFSNM